MSRLKVFIQNAITVFLSYFYGFVVLVTTVFSVLRHGRKFFYIRKRDTPPDCLTDTSLGKHRFVQVGTHKFHFVAAGDENKPLMLFVHGFPEFWFSWRFQLREFNQDYFTVALDMRGYGDTDKPAGISNYTTDKLITDLKDFIYAVGKSSAIVVAHDWGGALAWYLAAKHPEVVDKLIIMNAPHPVNFQKVLQSSWKQFTMSWYMFFFQLPYLPEMMLKARDLDVFNQVFRKRGEFSCTEEEIEAYKYQFSKPGAFTPPVNYYRANVKARFLESGTSKLNRITMPTLVVWGDRDIALSTELATGCASYVDNISVRLVHGGNHWVQMHKPKEVNTHMWEFLKPKKRK